MPIFNVGAAGTTSDSGFNIDNSLRFNSTSGTYLSLNQSTATSARKMTFSTWVKLSKLDDYNILMENVSSPHASQVVIEDNGNGNDLRFYDYDGSTNLDFRTSIGFRDVSAWYHIVVAMDTEQSTASNRVKIYVNGSRLTEFDTETYPSQNYDTGITNGTLQIGRQGSNIYYIDGYLAETCFIDGQQLDPTSFGEFDSDTGIWKPIEIDVSGITFGNNGFYLDYENSGALGTDAAGSNNLTTNNITAVDQSTDTPTNNFCTLNLLTARGGGTFDEGNLKYTASTGDSSIFGTLGIPPGMKVYFEVKLTNNTAQNAIGIHNQYDPGGTFVKGGSASGMYSFKPRGSASVTQYFNNGSSTNTSTSNYANDTIIGVAVDNENGQIHYSANGTYLNSSDPTDNNPAALVTGFGGSSEQYLHFSLDTTTSQPINQFNFGSPPYAISSGNSDGNGHGNFEYAVPSGYYALNTKNLAEFG